MIGFFWGEKEEREGGFDVFVRDDVRTAVYAHHVV